MVNNFTLSPDDEIRYLRFLNNTLQIKQLREEICDEYTRKIFQYLNRNPRFDSQVFCAFVYKFIYKCQLYKSLVMTAETNIYDKIRLDRGEIVNELYLFLDLHTVKFALSSVNPNQFHNVSIEEKLKHLIANNEQSIKAEYESRSLLAKFERKNNPSWKEARVEIIVPEMRGNTRIVPYLDLEFTLPRLSTEQKLDVIHFAICALNYLSQKDEPIETFSNPEISSTLLVSKPEHLKVVSDNLNLLRDSIILNAFRDKESDNEELNNLEFDANAPDVARILQAQSKDRKIEKQWADIELLTAPIPESEFLREKRLSWARQPFEPFKSDTWKPLSQHLIEKVSGLAELESEVDKKKAKKTERYPPHYLQQIIGTAVRLYEEKDKVRAIDIYTELHIEKNTYNNRIKYFGYDTSMILDKAREIVREREGRIK